MSFHTDSQRLERIRASLLRQVDSFQEMIRPHRAFIDPIAREHWFGFKFVNISYNTMSEFFPFIREWIRTGVKPDTGQDFNDALSLKTVIESRLLNLSERIANRLNTDFARDAEIVDDGNTVLYTYRLLPIPDSEQPFQIK